MQKSDGRGISRGENGGFRQTVEARGGLAEATIGQIRGLPMPGVVSPPLPLHSVLPGQHLVQTLYTRSLDPPELIDGPALWSRLAETHVVHLANDLETGVGIERKPRLMKKAIRAGSPRLTSRIEADARFANPDQQTSNSRRERDGRMGDASAWLEHQACESANRNVRTYTVSIDNDERSVKDVESPLFNEQDGSAILDRDGVGWRDSRHRSHDGQNLGVIA